MSVANPARKLWQNHAFDTTRIISSISASSHSQAETTFEIQNDHLQEYTSGQILKQVQDDYVALGHINVGCAHLRTAKKRIDKQKKAAFTLAEVLITLGIVGVVAALTLPALLTNVQAKIRAEQIRSAKYKFSLATEKMARLNLIGPYDSTDAFVDELQKHLKISKRCDVSNLRGCWPYETVDLGNGKTWKIEETRTGAELGMTTDKNNDYSSDNVGIVTADGTPMILSYNKKCSALDSLEKLTWATVDNKPESNASADCVASVFEINGTGKPNKLSNDVILFNAKKLGSACAFEVDGICFSAPYQPTKPMTKAECEAEKKTLGIDFCSPWQDYWGAGVRHCGGVSKVAGTVSLAKLADTLYKDGKLDSNAAVALGITGTGITFYTGGTSSSSTVWGYSFGLTSGRAVSGLNRDKTGRPVICIGN